jgi:hypothetical protein
MLSDASRLPTWGGGGGGRGGEGAQPAACVPRLRRPAPPASPARGDSRKPRPRPRCRRARTCMSAKPSPCSAYRCRAMMVLRSRMRHLSASDSSGPSGSGPAAKCERLRAESRNACGRAAGAGGGRGGAGACWRAGRRAARCAGPHPEVVRERRRWRQGGHLGGPWSSLRSQQAAPVSAGRARATPRWLLQRAGCGGSWRRLARHSPGCRSAQTPPCWARPARGGRAGTHPVRAPAAGREGGRWRDGAGVRGVLPRVAARPALPVSLRSAWRRARAIRGAHRPVHWDAARVEAGCGARCCFRRGGHLMARLHAILAHRQLRRERRASDGCLVIKVSARGPCGAP